MKSRDDNDERANSDSGRQERGETFLSRHIAKQARKRSKVNTIAVIVTGTIVVLTLFWIICFSYMTVSSNSMYPALHGTIDDRDRILSWRLAFWGRQPKRWEMIIFHAPTQAANRDIMPGFPTGGESGPTVKRVVGLPNEDLALAGGDVWTRPLGGGAYRRHVKPDSVQAGMWIGVYHEDFSDIRSAEEFFSYYWDEVGRGAATLGPEPSLTLIPESDTVGMRFRPLTRSGVYGDTLTLLPGVPDRYVLNQSVLFRCPNLECREFFNMYVFDQKILGRCPRCGKLAPETAVAYYSLRSGLPELGPYLAGFNGPIQGDEMHFRSNSYYFVGDLRIVTEIKLLGDGATVELELTGDGREAVARLESGKATVNGTAVDVGGLIRPGEWVRVEFYQVDGAVRLFLGPKRTPVFDKVLWSGDKPVGDFRGEANSIVLKTTGAGMAVRNLLLDRDVHYFSGGEQGWMNYLAAMKKDASIDVGAGTFLPLGDNTTVSLDGRSWGPVSLKNVIGKPIAILRPSERAGFIPSP